MPTADASLSASTAPLVGFEVRGSLPMELVWALLFHPDEPSVQFPERTDRLAGRTAAGRSDPHAFWDDGLSCFTEVLVAADRGGVLFESDLDRLWTGLAEGATAPSRFEPLTSETPEDQARIRARLARLHDDTETRAGWLQLLRDTWSAIEPRWLDGGRDLLEAMVWEVRAKLPPLGSYADLAPLAQSNDFSGLLPRLVGESAAAGQAVAVVPAWLGRNGFLLSLPDRLLWSPPNPVPPGRTERQTRDRARRHKALGDPTRLTIFEAAGRRPRSVGDLARELGVAQPTVSNHVRILPRRRAPGSRKRGRPALDRRRRPFRTVLGGIPPGGGAPGGRYYISGLIEVAGSPPPVTAAGGDRDSGPTDTRPTRRKRRPPATR